MLNRRMAGITTLALGIAFFAAGCGSSDDEGSAGGTTVTAVATTTQVADLVRAAGGEEVDVVQILQPNTDPHEYEPRPSDVEAFAEADVVFSSGGDLDPWTSQLVEDSGSSADVVDLSADLPVELTGEEHSHEEEHSGEEHSEEKGEEVDPHWWHDPVNAIAATGEIESALTSVDPGGSDAFAANAAAFGKELKDLDRSIAKCFDSIPDDQRKMVTDHDAFGYLANRYDINVVGTVIPALTTQAEPSAGELAELEETIRDEDVKAVFPESSVSKKLAEAVAADTGANTDYVLYGDTLGPEGSDGATYVEMMQANANNLLLGMTDGKQGCDFS